MKTSEAKKLKKGDRLNVAGIEKTCIVHATDKTGLSFVAHDLTTTGIVNWPEGEEEIDFPKPEPINHLLK
jgi:hypothetical protein